MELNHRHADFQPVSRTLSSSRLFVHSLLNRSWIHHAVSYFLAVNNQGEGRTHVNGIASSNSVRRYRFISRHSCAPRRCSRLRFSIALHHSTADNRVRIRLNGKHFLPAVHNQEAEVHCGPPLWLYGSSAPAVRADRVRAGNGLLCER